MTLEEIEDLTWSCIETAKESDPCNSDGYNENELVRAVAKMYKICQEKWEQNANNWLELMEAVEAERKDETSIEITDTLRENIGWHVINIMTKEQ